MFSGEDVSVYPSRKKSDQAWKWEKGETLDRDSSTGMASLTDTCVTEFINVIPFPTRIYARHILRYQLTWPVTIVIRGSPVKRMIITRIMGQCVGG